MRRIPLAMLALSVTGLVAVSPAAPSADPGGVPVLVVEGRGFGHGVGMAQDGAYWMGVEGASTADIIGHFYPGTSIAEAGGEVAVVVLTTTDDRAVIAFPAGGQVRAPLLGDQEPGFPVSVPPGGSVLVRHGAGRYVVEGGQPAQSPGAHSASGSQGAGAPDSRAARLASIHTSDTSVPDDVDPLPTTTTSAPDSTTTTTTLVPGPGTTTTAAPPPDPGPEPPPGEAGHPSASQPVWAVTGADDTLVVPARDARYRGAIEATAAAGPLRLRNHLDVEQYLRGMGEVLDPGWPQASLQSQAIAARTYALRAMAANGEICDVQRCQVYLGQQAEYRAMDAAVAATRGQVLVYGDRLASAVYSANGGGVSASTEEGFGTLAAPHPYLRAGPYLTRDPDPWAVVIALRDLAPRFGYRGTITEAAVTSTGPSGRPLEVTLNGDAGERVVPGLAFAAGLGLRSTLWTLRLDVAEEAPPPPEAAELVQGLPEELGDLLAAEAATEAGGPDLDERRSNVATAPADNRPGPPRWLTIGLLAGLAAAAAIGGVTLTQGHRSGF